MASEYSSAQALLQAYQRNYDWVNRHADELQKLAGNYIAVSDGAVLGSAKSREDLNRYEEIPGVYIDFVEKKGLLWIL